MDFEWRCKSCNRLLGKFRERPAGTIKCTRCGEYNHLSAASSTKESVVTRLETKECSSSRPASS